MYSIKFIRYWNGSFNLPDENYNNIDITQDDIELISADIDPIKFIGDDFFMRNQGNVNYYYRIMTIIFY